jgi:hypothetical protein
MKCDPAIIELGKFIKKNVSEEAFASLVIDGLGQALYVNFSFLKFGCASRQTIVDWFGFDEAVTLALSLGYIAEEDGQFKLNFA